MLGCGKEGRAQEIEERQIRINERSTACSAALTLSGNLGRKGMALQGVPVIGVVGDATIHGIGPLSSKMRQTQISPERTLMPILLSLRDSG